MAGPGGLEMKRGNEPHPSPGACTGSQFQPRALASWRDWSTETRKKAHNTNFIQLLWIFVTLSCCKKWQFGQSRKLFRISWLRRLSLNPKGATILQPCSYGLEFSEARVGIELKVLTYLLELQPSEPGEIG
jgi:hypothetical protein